MEFIWDDNTVRFMKEAYEYSDYNKIVAEKIKPKLKSTGHICDAGCGLGYLSLALSPYVGKVTAIDPSKNALEVLEDNIKKQNINNISVKHTKIENLSPDEKFDAMVFCFFGSIRKILQLAKRHCRGTVFIIKKNYFLHQFSVAEIESGIDTFIFSLTNLDAFNIPYHSEKWDIELGQPFKTFDDARLFFKVFSQYPDKSVITDDFIKSKLKAINSSNYRWYMPHNRKVGYICLEARDIAQDFSDYI